MSSVLERKLENPLYQALCAVLRDEPETVDWGGFSPRDWADFARLADVEGVAPMLYWKFEKEHGWPERFSDQAQTTLVHAYYNTLAQNTLLYQELDRILGALSHAEIPVVLLKGAALAATVYPDIGTRPMADLDLLVAHDYVAVLAKELISRAYVVRKITTYHAVFENQNQSKNTIEIHWNLVRSEFDTDTKVSNLYASIGKVNNPGFNGLTQPWWSLPLTENFLFLIAHLMIQHPENERRLLWFFDLHEVVLRAGKSVNWEHLFYQAETLGWREKVLSTLILLRGLFNTEVEKPKEEEIQSVVSRKDVTSTRERNYEENSPSLVELKLFDLLDFSTKRKLIFYLLFPAPEQLRRRYQSTQVSFWPLLYPIRWFALLKMVFLKKYV